MRVEASVNNSASFFRVSARRLTLGVKPYDKTLIVDLAKYIKTYIM
jgi:hypothetical protein